jgi:hypothetical protein
MPLLDHFRPPLSEERSWESFHAQWASALTAMFNKGGLPPRYFAETQVHFGGRVEVDVATLQRNGADAAATADGNGGVAVETSTATGVLMMPAVFPDEIEVRIIHTTDGPTLVGAIEFVSPRNKDRPESRRAFAAKCAAYLQSGIGTVVVDVVTARRANLHDELISLLEQEAVYRFPGDAILYTVAYRPVRTPVEGDRIEIRPVPLGVGETLPRMSLSLRGGPIVPVELEVSYMQARENSML